MRGDPPTVLVNFWCKVLKASLVVAQLSFSTWRAAPDTYREVANLRDRKLSAIPVKFRAWPDKLVNLLPTFYYFPPRSLAFHLLVCHTVIWCKR